ncbi:MAG: hypothetical protein WD273_14755 [Trueperaceae bacterium]
MSDEPKKVANEQEPSENPLQSFHSMMRESDRAAAILAAALIDLKLTEILEERFDLYRVPRKRQVELLRHYGPLSGFSSRTLACYCFGLITPLAFDAITTIRQVRNKFAHSADHELSFEDPEVVKILRKSNWLIGIEQWWHQQILESDGEEAAAKWKSGEGRWPDFNKRSFCFGTQMIYWHMEQSAYDLARASVHALLDKHAPGFLEAMRNLRKERSHSNDASP